MIKVAEIYVSTTFSLLQLVFLFWFMMNSQNSMSANHKFNNISIENYKQEIFPTFLLALIFQISIFDLLYNKKLILCMRSFDGRLYEPFAVSPHLKEISLIKSF